jgi:hypothetical protein
MGIGYEPIMTVSLPVHPLVKSVAFTINACVVVEKPVVTSLLGLSRGAPGVHT